jgi:hypothetical protein
MAGACSFPKTPGEGNLLNASLQHHSEIFEQGGRGQIILSMSDNLSSDGFFGTVYDNIMSFKNKQTGEMYFVKTKLGGDEFATAMLPIGEYEVTNLYLRYVYTTTQRQGNMTVTTVHVITHEHFEQDKVITFAVKPQEVVYLGHFQMEKPEKGATNKDGSLKMPSFKLEDDSDNIGDEQRREWKEEFGKDFIVRFASVRAKTRAELDDKKLQSLEKEVR